jgi:nitrous oxidase accessory protein
MYTRGVKMLNNFFENNTGDAAFGLLLKDISDSYISGNRFTNNTSGIFMEGGNRIQLQHNLFMSNGWALKIEANCSEVNVEGNNYIANTFDVSTNGSLVLNTFNNNYWDKYEGYDLNKDNIGDVPYRPVSMYSMLVEKNPTLMMLYRSFITVLMDKTEKVIPSLIPEALKDNAPLMKPLPL